MQICTGQRHALFDDHGDTTSETRRNNVIDNPHIVDYFFTRRVDSFLNHWLYKTLDALWHWYRHEYQGRGTIHSHGVAKLKNDPGLCHLTKTALKGYLAEKELEVHPDKARSLVPVVKEGKIASAKVVQYVDWLLSTHNPLPPDSEIWLKPNIHPCQIRHEDIITSDDSDFDYIDLLNSVQRHLHCSTSYCLQKSDGELKCRFKFPFDELKFEEIRSKDNTIKYRAKIVTESNYSGLNAHQRLQLQG